MQYVRILHDLTSIHITGRRGIDNIWHILCAVRLSRTFWNNSNIALWLSCADMCSAFCVSHIQHFLGKLIIFLNLLPPPMAKAMLSPPTGLSVYLSVCLCVCQSVCIFCLQKFTLFNLLILCFYVESLSGWRGCECGGGGCGVESLLATSLRNVSINFDGFNLDPDIFSCDHTVLETLPSVRSSDCPSVCLSHIVTVIMSSWNFQELLLLTIVMFLQKVKVSGQMPRS